MLVAGLALLFLPRPGVLLTFAALLILAGECAWAKQLLKKVPRILKGRIL